MNAVVIEKDLSARLTPVSIDVTVNYLGEMADQPYVHKTDQSKSHFVAEPATVTVMNAWPLLEELALDEQGFTIVKHPTAVSDFSDADEVAAKYPGEMIEIIKRLTGASHAVVIETPVARFTGVKSADQPGYVAHSDFIPENTAARLLAGGVDVASPELSRYRTIRHYQTWRALSGPGQDSSLALTDARSVEASELTDVLCMGIPPKLAADKNIDGDVIDPCNTLQSSRPNLQHEWYYFPRMERDELIVWKACGTDDPKQRMLHSAINDPSQADAPPRASIESRIFAFFD